MKRIIPSNNSQTNNQKYSAIFKCPSIYPEFLELKPGYQIFPPVQQIISNKMIIPSLRISHKNAQVYWNSYIDLSYLGAPLKHLIELGKDYIEVYPDCSNSPKNDNSGMEIQNQQSCLDNMNKPPVGFQLNKRCLASFTLKKRVKRQQLKAICLNNNCQLIQMQILSSKKCKFMVEIPHFTRYAFQIKQQNDSDGQADDSQLQKQQFQQNLKTQNNQIIDSLADFIKSRYITQTKDQEIQEQFSDVYIANLHKKQNLLNSQQYLNKIQQPSSKNIQEIQIYNEQRGQHFSRNQKGSQYCIGQQIYIGSIKIPSNEIVCCWKNQQTANKNIKFTLLQIQIQNMLKLYKYPHLITDYIVDQNYPIKIRQNLALFAICFHIQSSQFSFKKTDQHKIKPVRCLRHSRKLNDIVNHKIILLKDCLQWILNQAFNQKDINIPTNRYYQFMSSRRNEELVSKLLQYQRYDQAQFIANIDDIVYRNGILPKISQDLATIISQKMFSNQKSQLLEEIKSYHWLIRFAMTLWYQPLNLKTLNEMVNILQQGNRNKDDYFCYFILILQNFCEGLRKHKHRYDIQKVMDYFPSFDIIKNVSIVWEWYFSETIANNLLSQFKFVKNTIKFRKHKYLLINKIFNELIKLSSNYLEVYSLAYQFLVNDSSLSQNDKKHLITDVTAKFLNKIINHNQKQTLQILDNLIKQIQIIGAYKNIITMVIYIQKIKYFLNEFHNIKHSLIPQIMSTIYNFYKITACKQSSEIQNKLGIAFQLLDNILYDFILLSSLNDNQIRQIIKVLQYIHNNKDRSSNQDYKTIQIFPDYICYLSILLKKGNFYSAQNIIKLLQFHRNFNDKGIIKHILQVIYKKFLQTDNVFAQVRFDSNHLTAQNQKKQICDTINNLYQNDPIKKLQIISHRIDR